MNKQPKFRRGYVCEAMNDWGYSGMIEKGDTVIIDGCYSDLYGGCGSDSLTQYSVWPVRAGKVWNHVSWVSERELRLTSASDRAAALELVDRYLDERRAVNG